MTSSCRVRHHKTYNLPICFIIHWLSLLATTTTLTTTSTTVTALLSSANSIVNDATTEKRYRCLSVLQHQPISDKPVSSQPQQPFLFLFNIHLCLCVDSSVLGWAFNARPHSHKLNELANNWERSVIKCDHYMGVVITCPAMVVTLRCCTDPMKADTARPHSYFSRLS